MGEDEKGRGLGSLAVRLSRGGGRRCCILATHMTVCQQKSIKVRTYMIDENICQTSDKRVLVIVSSS